MPLRDRPPLRLVDRSPWNDPRAYRPDPVEMLRERMNEQHRPSYFAEVAADWREIASDVRRSPYSHGLVALAAIVFWTAVLVIPTMIGRGL